MVHNHVKDITPLRKDRIQTLTEGYCSNPSKISFALYVA